MIDNKNMVIQPEITTNSFTGKSGATYIVNDSLPTARYAKLEAFEAEIESGATVGGLLKQVRASYDAMNKGKNADAAVILYNTINQAERIEQGRVNTLILACTLFCCKQGEITNEWSEAEAIETVKDWGDIDPRFFLNCWARFQSAFMDGYGSATWSSSNESANDQENEQSSN